MNLKEYKFKSKESFIVYLKHLLIITTKNIVSYEIQLTDLDTFIKEKKLVDRLP